MIRWKQAALLGCFSWLIPPTLSFIIFPLKASNAPLFHNLLSLIGLVTGGILLRHYFRNRPLRTREALCVGILWFAMNLALDYPFFFHGPMQMKATLYYSQIGVAYLGIPVFAFSGSRLARS